MLHRDLERHAERILSAAQAIAGAAVLGVGFGGTASDDHCVQMGELRGD